MTLRTSVNVDPDDIHLLSCQDKQPLIGRLQSKNVVDGVQTDDLLLGYLSDHSSTLAVPERTRDISRLSVDITMLGAVAQDTVGSVRGAAGKLAISLRSLNVA